MNPPITFHIVVRNVVVLHHLYIGAALLILSPNAFLEAAGALIALDDIVEHLITADTPLRIFFDRYVSPRM